MINFGSQQEIVRSIRILVSKASLVQNHHSKYSSGWINIYPSYRYFCI